MSIDIEFVGNAGDKPKTVTFNDGNTVTSVSVGVNQGYYDKQQNWVDQGTAWFTVKPFGKQAESQLKHITKGVKLLVNGSLKTREYTDKQGMKRLSLEVTARRLGIVHTDRQQSQPEYGSPQSQPRASQVHSDPWGGNNGDPEF